MNYKELALRAQSLVVFDGLKEEPVIGSLQALLSLLGQMETLEENEQLPTVGAIEAAVQAYGAFTSNLYEACAYNIAMGDDVEDKGVDLAHYILRTLLEDDNYYVRLRAREATIPTEMEAALKEELNFFQCLAELSSKDVKACSGLLDKPEEDGKAIGFQTGSTGEKRETNPMEMIKFLPDWKNSPVDLAQAYETCMEESKTAGYGIFAKFRAFMINEEGLMPVQHPDDTRLDELFGYEEEKALVIKNTEALLAGTSANNLLLYGDAGTGKSSTVKAIASDYADRGLRLVEIRKGQLLQIPPLIDALRMVPLKFILYIDDLSFSKNDDQFSALKAILEGSVSDTGDNIAIYATSNRRHLVKETMEDREGDDVHEGDTIEEISSLANRFGLIITFSRPDKEEYLSIVKSLAKEKCLLLPDDILSNRAEAFAIRAGGRSPRTAKQFVELEKMGIAQM